MNLRGGQGVGLVDEVAGGALQVQGFGGEGVGSSPLPSAFTIHPSSFPALRVYSSRNAFASCILLSPGHSTRSQLPGGLSADAKRIQHRLGSGWAGVLAWCA
jgi:hypothetical protein